MMGCSVHAYLIVGVPISGTDLFTTTIPPRCGHRNSPGASFCSTCGAAILKPQRTWLTPQLAATGWNPECWDEGLEEDSPNNMGVISTGESRDMFFGMVLRKTGDLMYSTDGKSSSAVSLDTLTISVDKVRTYLNDLGLHALAAQVGVRLVGYVSC